MICMDEAGWGETLTADVLEDRYGLVADIVEPVHMGDRKSVV